MCESKHLHTMKPFILIELFYFERDTEQKVLTTIVPSVWSVEILWGSGMSKSICSMQKHYHFACLIKGAIPCSLSPNHLSFYGHFDQACPGLVPHMDVCR